MLFTDKFVYVHKPKTGGTFVAEAIKRLYQADKTRSAWKFYGIIPYRDMHFESDEYGVLIQHPFKHAPCRHIPAAHRHKVVLTTVRNPYDVYVSEFEFGWWKREQYHRFYRRAPNFEKRYGNFPALSFAQFVALYNEAFCRHGEPSASRCLGWQTQQFVKFYFKSPRRTFRRIDDDYIASEKYREDIFGVRFIHTERLNQELYEFLSEMGYETDDLDFILDLGKILPEGKARSAEQKWEKYYTPELKQFVREKERLLFKLFPEYDDQRAPGAQVTRAATYEGMRA